MSITKQQRKNVKTFLARWATIPSENVIRELHSYQESRPDSLEGTPTCNTIACAGGWMALMPEFKAMGVEVGRLGEPRMGRKWPDSVGRMFFGKWGLFDSRRFKETGTDHEVVRKRFEALL